MKINVQEYAVSDMVDPDLVAVDSQRKTLVLQFPHGFNLSSSPNLVEFVACTKLMIPVIELTDIELIQFGFYCAAVHTHVRQTKFNSVCRIIKVNDGKTTHYGAFFEEEVQEP